MIIERAGKFYRVESSEREISEMEFLREKIKELEGKVTELEMRPIITVSPVTYPCPCPCPVTYPAPSSPLNPTGPYYSPYEPIRFTCNTGSQ